MQKCKKIKDFLIVYNLSDFNSPYVSIINQKNKCHVHVKDFNYAMKVINCFENINKYGFSKNNTYIRNKALALSGFKVRRK
jgi:hypothetical protein